MKLPGNQTKAIVLGGGEDLVTPAITREGGAALLALNYEGNVDGGYRRIDGYERFDGQTAPSAGGTRASITAVPGSGGILGIAVYNNTVYAFRDNAGGTQCDLYESTAAGWSQVTLANTYSAGARVDSFSYNFTGTSGGENLYWANGSDRGVQFDGTTDTLINGTAAPTAPQHVTVSGNRLVFSSAGGQLDLSPVGDPTAADWSLTGGSINMGDEVTAMQTQVGGTLTVFCQDRINLVNDVAGTLSAASMTQHTERTGAREWTVQNFTDAIFLDTFGVSTLAATDAYGDFSLNSLSRAVEPLIDYWRGKETASLISRRKNQYRLYYVDTTNSETLVLTGTRLGDAIAWTRMLLPIEVTCTASGEIDGEERLFMGGADGFVYEVDKGTSFDGEEIIAVLRLPFNHLGAPSVRKRFRRIWADVDAPEAFSATLSVELDYADPDKSRSVKMTGDLYPGGDMWSIAHWGEFTWSSRYVGELEASLNGAGINLGVILMTRGTDVPAHTWQSIRVKYTPRAVDR